MSDPRRLFSRSHEARKRIKRDPAGGENEGLIKIRCPPRCHYRFHKHVERITLGRLVPIVPLKYIAISFSKSGKSIGLKAKVYFPLGAQIAVPLWRNCCELLESFSIASVSKPIRLNFNWIYSHLAPRENFRPRGKHLNCKCMKVGACPSLSAEFPKCNQQNRITT